MTTFLETVRKCDGEKRYYIGGCRATKQAFHSTGDGRKDCFLTKETKTHWRFYHERYL